MTTAKVSQKNNRLLQRLKRLKGFASVDDVVSALLRGAATKKTFTSTQTKPLKVVLSYTKPEWIHPLQFPCLLRGKDVYGNLVLTKFDSEGVLSNGFDAALPTSYQRTAVVKTMWPFEKDTVSLDAKRCEVVQEYRLFLTQGKILTMNMLKKRELLDVMVAHWEHWVTESKRNGFVLKKSWGPRIVFKKRKRLFVYSGKEVRI